MNNDLIKSNSIEVITQGTKWVTSDKPTPPADVWYCPTRDTFQARLDSFLSRLEKEIADDSYLLTAVIGEIGNNSFDHNLGNWRDVPGIFFASDFINRVVVLADRGQGIRKTIQRVKPTVSTDEEALKVAFTEMISGRAPERRGNGLKFVAQVLSQKKWNLNFFSGNARLVISVKEKLTVLKASREFHGCLAIIGY